jgi:hypothetical protein
VIGIMLDIGVTVMDSVQYIQDSVESCLYFSSYRSCSYDTGPRIAQMLQCTVVEMFC